VLQVVVCMRVILFSIPFFRHATNLLEEAKMSCCTRALNYMHKHARTHTHTQTQQMECWTKQGPCAPSETVYYDFSPRDCSA